MLSSSWYRVAGLKPRFTIYDEEDSVALLKGLLGKGEDRGSLRRALDEISRVKDIGVGPDAPPGEIARAGCDPAVFAAVVDMNVRPALQLTQALLPAMRAAK